MFSMVGFYRMCPAKVRINLLIDKLAKLLINSYFCTQINKHHYG